MYVRRTSSSTPIYLYCYLQSRRRAHHLGLDDAVRLRRWQKHFAMWVDVLQAEPREVDREVVHVRHQDRDVLDKRTLVQHGFAHLVQCGLHSVTWNADVRWTSKRVQQHALH